MKNIWSLHLGDGTTIRERVDGKHPVEKRISDSEVQPFINFWKVRLDDAKSRKDESMTSHIEKLLLFVEKHHKEELSLQIWSESKVSVLYAKMSDAGFIISEP